MVNVDSNTYISSILSQKDIWSIDDLIKLFKTLLLPFKSLDTSTINSSNDVLFLNAVVNELPYKLECYNQIVNKINYKDFSCDKLSINLFNADFGLDLVAFINGLLSKSFNINKIKSVKLFDDDKERLVKSLLLIKSIFPNLSVCAYDLDIERIHKECKCDSLLTINLFPHTYRLGNKQHKQICKLFLNSHFIYSHSIFFEYIGNNDDYKVSSLDCRLYWEYLMTGIYKNEPYVFDINPNTRVSGKKCTSQSCIYSNLSLEDISHKNEFEIVLPNLCPGIPKKNLFNEQQRLLFFDQPFKDNKQCEHIDDTVIVAENRMPFIVGSSKLTENNQCINQYTLKRAIEEFPQYEISEGLENNREWAKEVYKFYLNEAIKGNTKCYNNLGVLHILSYSITDDLINFNKGIKYLKKAAKGGDSDAMINLASYYMSSGNYVDAIKYYKMASINGVPAGSYSLGVVYHFGLYGYCIDNETAIKYYQKCIEQYYGRISSDSKSAFHISHCCLNLIILMNQLKYPYKDIFKVYNSVDNHSEELKYAYYVIRGNMTNKVGHDFIKLLQFKDYSENEPSYMTFNRIYAMYEGISIGDDNIKSNCELALKKLKELSNSKCPDWPEWERYIWPKLARWSYNANEAPSIYIQYWKNSIKADPENGCAYHTNIALTLSKDESGEIWKRYAFGYGCESCHECENYDSIMKCCPKAEVTWAKEYEQDEDIATKLLQHASKQKYLPALEQLYLYNFRNRFVSNIEDHYIDELRFRMGYHVPESFMSIIGKFSDEKVYNKLIDLANLGSKKAAVLIKKISIIRNDEYESLYWNAIYGSVYDILNILENIIDKNINQGYFIPNTILEEDYLKYANKRAKLLSSENQDEFEFLKSLAAFYKLGKLYKKSLELYKIAHDKGYDVAENINELEYIIEREKIIVRDSISNYRDNYEKYTIDDSLMDALDGELDAYWNID